MVKRRGWPGDLKDSRSWLVLTMKPGAAPLFELARAFVAQWTEPTDPTRERLAAEWAKNLNDALGLAALFRATNDQFRERFGLTEPGNFVLVIDQAEELYSRSGEAEARRFSEIIAIAAQMRTLTVLASLRSDHYGHFQADEKLFASSIIVDVPPLREKELRQVVERPPALLGARFEDVRMGERVVGSTARQPGALPLLSYLLEDLWKGMQRRGDGMLRWSDYPDLEAVGSSSSSRRGRLSSAFANATRVRWPAERLPVGRLRNSSMSRSRASSRMRRRAERTPYRPA